MLTNRDVASALDCSPTMASRMRNGKRAPSVSMLRRTVEAFGLDLAEAVAHAEDAVRWGAYIRDTVYSRERVPARAFLPTGRPPGCTCEMTMCIDMRVGHAQRCPLWTPQPGPTALQVEWRGSA